jgi:hypothetical protein
MIPLAKQHWSKRRIGLCDTGHFCIATGIDNPLLDSLSEPGQEQPFAPVILCLLPPRTVQPLGPKQATFMDLIQILYQCPLSKMPQASWLQHFVSVSGNPPSRPRGALAPAILRLLFRVFDNLDPSPPKWQKAISHWLLGALYKLGARLKIQATSMTTLLTLPSEPFSL